MTLTRYLHAPDLHGLARLAVDGVSGTSRLVEQLHGTIARAAAPIGSAAPARSGGVTGLVYRSIRAVNGAVGASIDTVATPLMSRLPPRSVSPVREGWLAALNGILGDHLVASDNPLAIDMAFRLDGESLVPDRLMLAKRLEGATGKLLIAVHGLCMNDLHWQYIGEAGDCKPGLPMRLGRSLGYTPLYLHYNSGRRIQENAAEFAEHLEALVRAWPVPVESVTILAHSMGGLVARNAYDRALDQDLRWADALDRIVYLGTPHHGAPLERAGHRFESLLDLSPYAAPFKRLGEIRSAGIVDLRHGGVQNGLAGEAEEFAIAATARTRAGRLAGGLLGDELVPVDSALGRHADPERALAIPERNRRVIPGIGHLGLLHHPEVYRSVHRWLR